MWPTIDGLRALKDAEASLVRRSVAVMVDHLVAESRDDTDIRSWRTVVTQIADTILGVPSYQKAESFRDGEIERSRRFLMQKGLPNDFLERIPPLRTKEQTRASILRIESIVRD